MSTSAPIGGPWDTGTPYYPPNYSPPTCPHGVAWAAPCASCGRGYPMAPGVRDVVSMRLMSDGAEACALGWHAWMPWLPITTDEGVTTMYVTFCVRCRHHEQYDLGAGQDHDA